MATITTNHFSEVVQQLKSASPNQRASVLIDAISQEMIQSGNPQCQHLGEELQQAKPQLLLGMAS